MPKYNMTACVTISLHAVVEAKDEKDAIKKASRLNLPSIHEDVYEPDPEDGDWHTSGELDGEPFDIEVDGLCDG